SFDFPPNEENSGKGETSSEKKPENKTDQESKKIVFDLNEEDEETQNSKGEDGIEVVPTTEKDGTKRYSLEDYMDFEQEMENARPPKKSTKRPANEEVGYERKTDVKKEAVPEKQTEENDPFDNPISEDLIARAAERRA